jgi:DNA-binding IclR family transcriptional regulator
MALPRPSRATKKSVADSGFSTPGLDRALAILSCLGAHPSGLSLSEIAAQLGLSTNFVYRTTQSLVAHGYLLRDGEKRFSIGPGLLRLSQPFVDDVPLAEAALPAMRWLSEQTGEAAHLGIISGEEGIVLERVIGRAMIKFYVERGTRFPLHTSGPGKVMLAYRDTAERDQTIAAPIFDAEGEAIASLWITGTSQRLDAERIAKLTHVVTKAAKMASEALQPKAILH